MKELLHKYEKKEPEIVFHWNDPETEAKGWTVINSLRGGAAGGGTRMRKGLDKNEVISLAKTMEIKFTVSGPAIGGAKSGIDFDPSDPRKKGVLERWYKAVSPLLKSYYGTGGDLNVDEINEVIPITENCGVWHPQEGVQLRNGVIKVLETDKYSPDTKRKYTVADMITGFGVAESVKHYYNIYDGNVRDKKVIVQGFGNVGSSAAFYLSKLGANIIGIIDRNGGLINKKGFSHKQITDLFLHKDGNELVADNMLSFDEVNQEIWQLEADVFLPCAASRLVQKKQIDSLISNGLELVASGANVPFADKGIFFGPIMEYVDNQISLIPDFIANCGMARVFAYFMERRVQMTDDSIFKDTSITIENAIQNTFDHNSDKKNISQAAFELSLNQLL